MNVNVQTQDVVIPRNDGASLAERARIVLARFKDRITRLELTLKDINGPRGGRDKVCMVRAELIDGRQIIAIDRNTTLRRAIGGSLRRAKALIANGMARGRSKQRALGRSGSRVRLGELAA